MNFVSICVAGTETIAEERLRDDFSARFRTRSSGILIYETKVDGKKIAEAPYLNNSFILIDSWKGRTLEYAAKAVADFGSIPNYAKGKRTFRVMFSDENTFVAVQGATRAAVEASLSTRLHLRCNRNTADVEYWFIRRSGGEVYFAQRLPWKTPRVLKQGELRPEIANTLLYLAGINGEDLVCDPFCGSGAIAREAFAHFRFSRFVQADVSKDCVADSKKAAPTAETTVQDFFQWRPEAEFDAIVTDPPWGKFDQNVKAADFYPRLAEVLDAALKPGGRAVFLGPRAEDNLGMEKHLEIRKKYDILVNGAKARIYVTQKKENI